MLGTAPRLAAIAWPSSSFLVRRPVHETLARGPVIVHGDLCLFAASRRNGGGRRGAVAQQLAGGSAGGGYCEFAYDPVDEEPYDSCDLGSCEFADTQPASPLAAPPAPPWYGDDSLEYYDADSIAPPYQPAKVSASLDEPVYGVPAEDEVPLDLGVTKSLTPTWKAIPASMLPLRLRPRCSKIRLRKPLARAALARGIAGPNYTATPTPTQSRMPCRK